MESSTDFIDDCLEALGDTVFSEALDISEGFVANDLFFLERMFAIDQVSNRQKVTWRRGTGGEAECLVRRIEKLVGGSSRLGGLRPSVGDTDDGLQNGVLTESGEFRNRAVKKGRKEIN